MFGQSQVQKTGLAANGTSGQFAVGWYQSAGFIADPKSPNGSPGNLWDALNLIVPNSGQGADALKSFSVIAQGNFGGSPAGVWKFNLCLANPPLPALTSEIQSFYVFYPGLSSAKYNPQVLPTPSASATQTVSTNSTWKIEADVTVSNGSLSGVWTLFIDGSSVQTGSLTNLPANLNEPIAAYLQLGQMPQGAAVSNVVLAVSVAGFTGNAQNLNS